MIKLFESFQSDEEIHDICEVNNIINYTINSDRTLSVDGDVSFYYSGNKILSKRFGYDKEKLTKLPLRFKEVSGYFECDALDLISLEGCPEIVGDNFECDRNRLTSLVGGPKRVIKNFKPGGNLLGGNYFCGDNNIMTFHGFPEHITGNFYCTINPIYAVWEFFEDKDRVELLNEMDPLRVIDGKPHVILDIFNDFLSIIGKPEVESIIGYINI